MDKYFDINLQLFADEEELDDLEELDDEVTEDLEAEELDEDVPEDDEEEAEDKPPKDKVTNALIEKKRELKRIKDEKDAEINQLRVELDAIKQAGKDEARKKSFQSKKQEYSDAGYDELVAESLAKQEVLEKRLDMMKYERQAEKLEGKFPKVWDKLEQFSELSKSAGWTLEKLCEAEFGKSVSEFDVRTKTEQEALLRRKKQTMSKPVATGSTPLQTAKLSESDERAYQFYAKKNPNVSRKQYKDNVLNPKWEE